MIKRAIELIKRSTFIKAMKNSLGFSLAEVMIAAGIFSLVGMGVMKIIGDSNEIFSKSFNKVSNYFDESIFFKELVKQIELSKVIKGGIIECSGDNALSSVTATYVDGDQKEVSLDSIGDSLSFVFAESTTLGTFDSTEVQSFLSALTLLNEKESQKVIWNRMGKDATDPEMVSLQAEIDLAQGDIDSFDLSSDAFTLNILDPGRFKANDLIQVSTIAGNDIAGIFKVESTNAANNKITLSSASFPASFTTLGCDTKSGENLAIKDIVIGAASLGAMASSSVILTKLRLTQYLIDSASSVGASNPGALPSFKLFFHETAGVKERMSLPLFAGFTVLESWSRLSGTNDLMLNGKFKAAISFSRHIISHTGKKVLVKSEGVAHYNLNSSSRSNFSIATSPKSSEPVVPSATTTVSPFYLARSCDNPEPNPDPTGCVTDGDNLKSYLLPNQFFRITAYLDNSFDDVSFTVTSSGIECWGPLSNVKIDESIGELLFDTANAKTGTITLSKDFSITHSRAYEANCRFKRFDPMNSSIVGSFEGGHQPGDGDIILSIKMSYYDYNAGSVVNKVVGQKRIPIYLGEVVTLETGGAGDCIPGDYNSILEPKYTVGNGKVLPRLMKREEKSCLASASGPVVDCSLGTFTHVQFFPSLVQTAGGNYEPVIFPCTLP